MMTWLRSHARRAALQSGSSKQAGSIRRRPLIGFEPLEPRQLLAIDINIIPGLGLEGNDDALAAFERAALAWEYHIADDIVVNIDADLADLGDENVIGQTGSVLLVGGYDLIRNQLVLDSAGETDDAIVAALPTAGQASFQMPKGFKLDGNLLSSKAALKAAGFAGLDAQFGDSDAEITFNSTFSFDYDNSLAGGGVSPDTMDFETVAIHEIGHALGFISEVDTIDFVSGVGGKRPRISPSTLDLYRFPEAGNNPADQGSSPRCLAR